MPLQEGLTKFTTASQIIATYDYVDLADGAGVRTFYGFSTKIDTTDDYHLTRNTSTFSNDIEKTYNPLSTSFVKGIDLDFDLSSFNFAQDLKGTAIVNVPIAAQRSGDGGSTNVSVYAIVRIRKWDGSTETEIANAQTETQVSTAAGVIVGKTCCVPLTIPETHLAEGETLRLTIEGWGKFASGAVNTGTIAVGHDPQNRDGVMIRPSTADPQTTTKLTAHIPFKIQQ